MGIQVLVADGHHIVREAMAKLLGQLGPVDIVEQAASGEEALKKAEVMRPDVVVLDLVLDGALHGIDLVASIRRKLPGTRIVVLTNDGRRGLVDEAMRAGAASYLLKSCSLDQLESAIRGLPTDSTPKVGSRGAFGDSDGKSLGSLSRREREVLTLIAQGGTTKSIAAQLGISPKTVEKHRGKLSRKLAIRSVAGLTRFAIENEIA